MKNLILGPTFVLRVADAPDAVADRLARWLTSPACPVVGTRQGLHLQLAVPARERHRWSPWLTVEVREPMPMPRLPPAFVGDAPHAAPELSPDPAEDTASGSEVFARFNPSPAIWTGYMLASLALLTTILGSGMWGVAQLTMHRPPTALWLAPACGLVLVAMWALSAAGQRLAADEMHAMRAAIESAIE